jgi:chorismate dehydratase
MLRAGLLDVALVSSIEWFRDPGGYGYIPGLGVGSDGPVDSVRIYLTRPPRRIRTLALDPNSLTANALAQIVLRRRYGADFRIRTAPADRERADARVVIGDPALASKGARYLDLGREWKSWIGLPFVYALWIYRKGSVRPSVLARRLDRAYARGRDAVDRLAEEESRRLCLDKAYCLRYLRSRIRYRLGPRDIEGLERFGRYLKELNLI